MENKQLLTIASHVLYQNPPIEQDLFALLLFFK